MGPVFEPCCDGGGVSYAGNVLYWKLTNDLCGSDPVN